MYTNDDLENLSQEDKKRKRHSVEMEMVMLESDNRKLLNEKNVLDTDIRKLKKDEERIRITLDEKRKQFDKVTYQVNQNEVELKGMKKKLNFL